MSPCQPEPVPRREEAENRCSAWARQRLHARLASARVQVDLPVGRGVPQARSAFPIWASAPARCPHGRRAYRCMHASAAWWTPIRFGASASTRAHRKSLIKSGAGHAHRGTRSAPALRAPARQGLVRRKRWSTPARRRGRKTDPDSWFWRELIALPWKVGTRDRAGARCVEPCGCRFSRAMTELSIRKFAMRESAARQHHESARRRFSRFGASLGRSSRSPSILSRRSAP